MRIRLSIIFTLVILLTIYSIHALDYPSEYLPKEELTYGVISSENIKFNVTLMIHQIVTDAEGILDSDPSNPFQRLMFNLYSSFDTVGEPKLIFNETGPEYYAVPLLVNQSINSYILLDPYNARVLSYPSWTEPGIGILKQNYTNWVNMEEIAANMSKRKLTNQSRLILIQSGPQYSTLYLSIPEENKSFLQERSINNSSERTITKVELTEFMDSQKVDVMSDSPRSIHNISLNWSISNIKPQIDRVTGNADTGTPIWNLGVVSDSFYIAKYQQLPFKDQAATLSWVNYVNTQLNPTLGLWNNPGSDHKDNAWKCLSYAASTVADWFSLMRNETLGSYRSFINGQVEYGHNPRELEVVYHLRHQLSSYYLYTTDYCIYYSQHLPWWLSFLNGLFTWVCDTGFVEEYLNDPITNEGVPYNLGAYSQILEVTNTLTNYSDPLLATQLPEYKYTTRPYQYNIQHSFLLPASSSSYINALRNYGILYSQMWDYYLFNLIKIQVHAIPIVGYGSLNGNLVFVGHDSFGNSTHAPYLAINYNDLAKAYAFVGAPTTCMPMVLNYTPVIDTENMSLSQLHQRIEWYNPCDTQTWVFWCSPDYMGLCNNSDSVEKFAEAENGEYIGYALSGNISNYSMFFNKPGKWSFFIKSFINTGSSAGNYTFSPIYSVDVMGCTVPNVDYLEVLSNTSICPGNYYNFSKGIHIANSNLILDCQGSNFYGNNSSLGLYLTQDSYPDVKIENVTVKNCHFYDYREGMEVWSSNNNYLLNNIVSSTTSGIFVYNSNNTVLDSNYVNNTYYPGIDVQQSKNVTVISNFVSNVRRFGGIRISHSDNCTIFNNNLINNSLSSPSLTYTSSGLRIESSNNCVATGNIFMNNLYYNVLLVNSFQNILVNNSISYYDINDTYQLNNTYCLDGYDNEYLNGATGPTCPNNNETCNGLDDNADGEIELYYNAADVGSPTGFCIGSSCCDNKVSMNELLTAIGIYKINSSQFSMNDLLNTIGKWKRG